MFYSASRKGFFEKAGDAPDTVEISKELYQKLLAAPRIEIDANGRPVPADHLPPSGDIVAEKVRVERNAKLSKCDWVVLPDSPLTSAQKTEWKTYRQSLRDLTSQSGFPAAVDWPLAPK